MPSSTNNSTGKPEQLALYGVRWAPYRTAAAWYLWRAADFLNGDAW
jgi:DNA-3-methyladenine glycosylase II